MLKISRLADYATLIMCHLAQQPDERYSAAEIAKNAHLALPTTSKLLKLLNEADLVQSVRGINGGYQLAREANAINLKEIVSAIEGDVALTVCTPHEKNCIKHKKCGLYGNWQMISGLVTELLQKITLADMRRPINKANMSTLKNVITF